jgi:hypothetical protein
MINSREASKDASAPRRRSTGTKSPVLVRLQTSNTVSSKIDMNEGCLLGTLDLLGDLSGVPGPCRMLRSPHELLAILATMVFQIVQIPD